MPPSMLGTDTCSYIMKRSHPLALKRLQSFSVDDVCMSVVTKAELPGRRQDAAAGWPVAAVGLVIALT